MLFTIRKCVFQLDVHLLKRFIFYSPTSFNNGTNEGLKLEFDDGTTLEEEKKKLLKVAMLGLPNVGKSTLVNKLLRRSVCPTSSRVHTTMHKTEAVYTEGNTQIVFMDTPGLITSKEMKTYKLIDTFKEDPKTSIVQADVIGLIQDVTNVYTRHKFDKFFLDYVNNKREDTQVLLILNKVDKLKKKDALLEITRLLTSKEKNYPKFDDIFMVSALNGDGVDDLKNYLVDSAKVTDWKYQEEFYTDQPIQRIVIETVRAKLLDILPREMPYKMKVELEHFNVRDDGSISILVRLECPKESYATILLKYKAMKLKCLSHHIEKDLRHAFRTAVTIRLNVVNIKKKSI